MKNIRIIPRLDIKGPNLVKGIHLEGLRVMGKPADFAKYYYETGADELMYQDVVASLYDRNSLHSIIEETASNIFIPITVGGGIRSIDDIRSVLRAGADKVCLNTEAIRNPQIIKDASRQFGSSTIVVAIEAIRETNGEYLCYVDNGRDHTGVNVHKWAEEVAELGAGEIVLTSVDREGTGEGYDLELVRSVADSVNIPVIAHGGAGKPEDVTSVIKEAGADAVALASLLHYDYIKNYSTDSASSLEGNVEFLNKKRNYHTFETSSLPKLKKYLIEHGVNCRFEP